MRHARMKCRPPLILTCPLEMQVTPQHEQRQVMFHLPVELHRLMAERDIGGMRSCINLVVTRQPFEFTCHPKWELTATPH